MKARSELLEKLRSVTIVADAAPVRLRSDIRSRFTTDASLQYARASARRLTVARITYRSPNGHIVGYVLVPKVHAAPLPCIVWNRGGHGEFSAIHEGQLFAGQLAAFARAGYVVIASQYGGNAGGDGVDEFGGSDVHDVLALYTILKEWSVADDTRIGIYGASRGGIMTYRTLAQVSWARAAAVTAGVSNLYRNANERPAMREKFLDAFGAHETGMHERSALYWPEALPATVPILLQHGTADWRVNPLDSYELAGQLMQQRKPHRLILYEGGDHALSEFKHEVNGQVISWFHRFVRDGDPLPDMTPHGA
jgi:dipeptidyl aminopeptidase/acylaminoacyl peptidase